MKTLLHLFIWTLLFIGIACEQTNTKTEFRERQLLLAEIDSLNRVAFYMQYTDNGLDSAIRLNESLFNQLPEPTDSLILSNLLSVKSSLYAEKRIFITALPDLLHCLSIRKQLKNPLAIAKAELNLANLYEKMVRYEDAITYLNSSIENRKLANDEPNQFAISYNSLGLLYYKLNVVDSAFKYYNLALELSVDSSYTYVDVLSNISIAYRERLSLPDKALELLLKIEDIQRIQGWFFDLAWTINHIGKAYIELKEYDRAIAKLKEGLAFAQKYKNEETEKDICYSLYHLGIEINEIELIDKWLNRYEVLKDTLDKKKNDEAIQKYAIKYKLAEQERESEKYAADAAKNKQYALGAGLLLIAIGILAFYINRNSIQKQTISSMQLQLKEQEINEIIKQQEASTYAALLKGQEEERQRIASDLHDRLGSTLATLRLSLGDTVLEKQKDPIELVDLAVTEVREVAHNLYNGALVKYGLNTALQELKQLIEQSTKMKVQLFLSDGKTIADQTINLQLYRIIQELINNTMKHARATTITIQTIFEEEYFSMIYEDNGIGFEMSKVIKGIGLQSIADRAKKIQANCHIDSKKGRGAIVIIDKET